MLDPKMLSDAELADAVLLLEGERERVRSELKALIVERDRRLAEKELEASLAKLSPAAQKILKSQVIVAEGIESEAVVGTPGK